MINSTLIQMNIDLRLSKMQIYLPWTLANKYELAALCCLFLSLYYISRKTQKQVKFIALSLKIGPHFSFLIFFFFSLNNAKKKLYVNVPEMLNFNLKKSIQKYLIFYSWYNLFNANVSDFYALFIAKN